MKKLGTIALVATAVASTFGLSQTVHAEVSANVGAQTNYVWRGVSQSSDSASVNGGLDYAADSGFYAGTWVGSLGDGAGAETDFYLGFGGESGDFAYDVGYIYYAYTDLDDSDFGEVYFNGGFGNFGFGVAYTVNSQVDDGSAFDTGDIFASISYGGIDLGNEFELGFTAGMYMFDADGADLGDDVEADYDYAYLQADIAKGDFTFSISKAQDEGIADGDLKFVASWSTSF